MHKLVRLALSGMFVIMLVAQMTQAQQGASISQLRDEIQKLESVDADPEMPAEVKGMNRKFMEERRRQLDGLLRNRLTALRKYKASVGTALSAAENQAVSDTISLLEAELEKSQAGRPAAPQNAAGAAFMEASIRPARAVTAAPPAAVAQTPCTDPVSSVVPLKFRDRDALEVLQVRLKVTVDPSSQSRRGRPPGNEEVEVIKKTGERFTLNELDYAVSASDLIDIFPRRDVNIPLTTEDELTVVLRNFKLNCGDSPPTTVARFEGTSGIADRGALLTAAREKLAEAVAHAKTSDEKNIFAGFTAAKGDGGDAAGAADIALNHTIFPSTRGVLSGGLFDRVITSLQIKKSSADNADPRHFSTSMTFQKTFLLDSRAREARQKMRDLERTGTSELQQISRSGLGQSGKGESGGFSKFFRAFLIDESLRLEGEAFDFKTVNFVSDTQFQLASISKRLGKGSNGFFNVRLLFGPELGRNLSKPEEAEETDGGAAEATNRVDWIARLKGGGKMTLRYLPADTTGSQWGVELDLAYVHRYLFNNEAFTETVGEGDEAETKLVTIGKGHKGWAQADLKVFLFGDDKARYGIKATFNRGYLPPAFTFTKGFQVGFVVETTDDKSNDKPANEGEDQ